MIDSIVGAIRDFFLNTVGEELCVLFCSMIPIIELRGAIPMGAIFGMPWWQSYILAVIGNMLPVPFILLLIKAVIGWMAKSKVKFFNKIADFLLKRVEKRRDQIEKYSFWGVCLFVAIPLPVTGAWTGSLIAALLGIKFKKAFPAVIVGIIIATIIMSIVSYGLLGAIIR